MLPLVRPSCGVAPVPPPPPPLPPSRPLDRERLRTLPREALRRRSLALPLRPLSRRGDVGRRGSPPRPPPPPLPPSRPLDREGLCTLPREALRRRSLALPLRPLSRRGDVGRRGSPPRPPPPPLPPSRPLDRERLRTLPREALRSWRISCLRRSPRPSERCWPSGGEHSPR
ncbi:hypothetical protein MNEG_10449 [Monoraphidium neglectum]|uniref:Uncharacterized protein n=1 Tax=Monoraphidium neglectum TaxID=145388 RepID=A0A0D2MSL6_9CHLO|nr:hypothetical protein MNEG_10449 [Monoraphidium neglectum]KIY97515.1 hypothetical protein MNEG_10449 [Monoraphidium neglectum]|eukprot:XP_013896535.1 hypothetical protein MNEG_10449 [Monoraphidium neglectum]